MLKRLKAKKWKFVNRLIQSSYHKPKHAFHTLTTIVVPEAQRLANIKHPKVAAVKARRRISREENSSF